MLAHEKFKKVFGEIHTLGEPISWSTGVSNMLEWLTWNTSSILGISKTDYRKKVIQLCIEAPDNIIDQASMIRHVNETLDKEMGDNEPLERYAPAKYTVASARESLRRSKYFSEDYLNKEFDILWTLVSDEYLDHYYRQFTSISGGGQWCTHGNSGLFEYSTRINETFMDNLSYNASEGLLIANELKLGGKKNPDQMLKYSLMFRQLIERGFISEDTRFVLLFIGDKPQEGSWNDLLDAEIEYCRSSSKSTAISALHPKGLELASRVTYYSTTWTELAEFNERYSQALELPKQQVESKLLWGFNETLSQKAFIHR